MKVIVKPHKIKIELEHDYNSGEYNVQECNFEFSDEYTGLSKVVVFSNSNVTKEIQIYNDRCIVPAEVLQNEGVVGIGVYGYEVSGDELTLRYSPKPQCFPVEKGSYAEGTQPAPPTPSVVEQLQQQITNNANNISSLQDLTTSQGEQIETNTNDISSIKSEQTTQNNKIQANTEKIESINGIIPTLAKKTEIPTKVSQLENDSNYVTETEMSNAIDEEKTERENADIELQSQIDAITVSPDVVDVVGTYQELLDYDTSKLTDDDIIKVLLDSTHNNALSYYRWQITGGIGSWQYVGSEGPFYTKSETNSLLNEKQDEITNDNKLDSDLVKDDGQTNKFVTAQEKTTWNNKQDALTFDNTPTENSNNPVKSGGIYDFVNTKLEDYVLETDFEESQSLQDEEIARNKMIYNAMPKVSGEGTDLTLDNTAECPVYDIELSPSALEQESTSISGGDEYDSPSPEHPQQIHTVSGENSIKVGNKNLALTTWAEDFVSAVNNNTRAKLETKDGRNCLWFIPQAGYGYYSTMNFTLETTFKENTQYTISYDILKTDSNSRTVAIHYTDGTTTTNQSPSAINVWEHQTITSTAGKTIDWIQPYYTSGNTYIDIDTWQIEEGTTATDFESHQEQTYPISLGDLEYCKIGDYEDLFFKNVVGSEYYDSTLELDKWYLKKNIGKVVLDGSESWTKYNNFLYYYNESFILSPTTSHVMPDLISNNFTISTFNDLKTNPNIYMSANQLGSPSNQRGVSLYVNDYYSDVSTLKIWLSTHNTTVYYALATPTYTLLSETLQTQLDNIQKAISYQDQTNVSQTNNDLPFVIKLSAIRDLSGIFELIQG